MHVFVVDYAYRTSVEQADQLLDEHLDCLDAGYEAGVFLASGRKHPRTGGIMLAVGSSRSAVEKMMGTDPFVQHGIIDYRLTEFVATKTAPELERVRSED